MGSLKIFSHFEKTRLLVRSTLRCSYRCASNVKSCAPQLIRPFPKSLCVNGLVELRNAAVSSHYSDDFRRFPGCLDLSAALSEADGVRCCRKSISPKTTRPF